MSAHETLGLGSAFPGVEAVGDIPDYFLTSVLESKNSHNLGRSRMGPVLGTLENLVDRVLPKLDENSTGSTTRDRWTLPLFYKLGFRDPEMSRCDRVWVIRDRPHSVTHIYTPKNEGDCIPLDLAAWGEDLSLRPTSSHRRGGDRVQYRDNMRMVLDEEGSEWGIISNGHTIEVIPGLQKDGVKIEGRLKFDLPTIAEEGDNSRSGELLVALLRPEAFLSTEDDGVTTPSLWQHALQLSRDEKSKVGGELGPGLLLSTHLLIGALVKDADSNPDIEFDANEDLDDLHRHGVTLLFRLLFLLFGEATGRLPVMTTLYRENLSMEHIKDLLDERMRSGRDWSGNRNHLWMTFQSISRLIGLGGHFREGVSITALGGSLFEPSKWDSLKVPDSIFSEVLLNVSHRATSRGRKRSVGRARVSYRELDVEQIGSVYESLLEYSPAIAEQRYVWKLKKGWPILQPDPDGE